jgi:hypothetical protein
VAVRRLTRELAEETVQTALGRNHRDDPELGPAGGPAGNARLTAWTGLVLLALFLAELVTLLDVRGLISWHVAVGALLVPPALLKTVTTGWRIVQYYGGAAPYREAGPPPMLLRLLGPLVVLSTLGVLGTGVAVVLAGPDRSRRTLLSLLGLRVDAITLHQGAFAVWAVATGLHTLGRFVPALQATVVSVGGRRPARVRGRSVRVVVLALALLASVLLAVVLVRDEGKWSRDHGYEPPPLRSSKAT